MGPYADGRTEIDRFAARHPALTSLDRKLIVLPTSGSLLPLGVRGLAPLSPEAFRCGPPPTDQPQCVRSFFA